MKHLAFSCIYETIASELSAQRFVKTEKALDMMHQKTRDLLSSPSFFSRPRAAPSSFAETGSPDSFADLDAKLKALEEKTKAELAKLQSDTAAPSSFMEEGAPDSFADLDAKLKALEEKTKAELAKLQSDTAAPSSFVEEGAPDSFADLDAKLKALEEKTKAELAKLQSDTAAPSSLLQWSSEITDDELARGEREAERVYSRLAFGIIAF